MTSGAKRVAQLAVICNVSESVRGDQALIDAGWQRRYLAEPAKAVEASVMYESLGFEVICAPPEPTQFSDDCGECRDAACKSYLLIYTRRPST